MIDRVRSKARPGDNSQDIKHGPHEGIVSPLPLKLMRLPLDEAIAEAARRGHPIKVSR